MKRNKWLPLIGLLIIVAILGAGCGAARGGNPVAPPVASDYGGVRESLPSGPQVAPMPMAPTAVPAMAGSAGSAQVGDKLIIKTGNITMVVTDVTQSVSSITAIATEVNGFVASTTTGRKGDQAIGSISIRVPANTYDSVMAKIREMALEPPTESNSGQDVTEEYSDLEAQLRNLQATEKQLLVLLDRATTVDDTLKVYNQLTNIRGQIERLQGRLQYLQKSAAMSTITVNLQQKVDKPIVKTGTEAWQPSETLKAAARSLVSALQGLGDLAIWAVVFAPICIIPLAILWIIWRLARRRARGGKQS